MSTKKTYIAQTRIETREKGKKVVIPAGTMLELTPKQAAEYGDCLALSEDIVGEAVVVAGEGDEE